MLDAKIKHYEQHKETLYITPAKFKNDYPFLKDADSLALSNAQLNLEKAFNAFFQKKTGFPKFKSKHKCRWSYTTNNQRNKKNPEKDSIRFDGNRIKFPKVGYVKIVEHRQHEGREKQHHEVSICVAFITFASIKLSCGNRKAKGIR